MEQICLLQPVVHVSGRFAGSRHYLAPVLPLAWHPRNRNALIVCDLQADVQPLLELDAETLRRRLYTRRDELGEGELPVPLKLLHINKCPVVAPLKVLREQDLVRLQLDLAECERQAELLRQAQAVWQAKLADIYASDDFAALDDPEQQLYSGFLGDRDKRLCEQVRAASAEQLARDHWAFADARLDELLFRYRARNFPSSLAGEELVRWREFCRQRLSDSSMGAPNTLDNFAQALQEEWSLASPAQQQVLQAWREHAQLLRSRYGS
jgi:exodeoxyribonuclease-1